MRKALIPMLASLALCGAGTLALIASDEHAQASPHTPVMVPVANTDVMLAQNFPDAPPDQDAQQPAFGPDFQQRCDDRFANEAGHMAYLEARLQLTDAEQPLFAHWKDIRLDIAKRGAADCKAHAQSASQDRADPVDRMSREEDMLKHRIADLDTERPIFAALYAALTPEQRDILSPHPRFERNRRSIAPRPAGADNPPPPPPAL
jgi:hypothetical protein